MTKQTYFRCMGCRAPVRPSTESINRPWTGWNSDGSTVLVDNKCCPECGSNDLVYFVPSKKHPLFINASA